MSMWKDKNPAVSGLLPINILLVFCNGKTSKILRL